MAIADPPAITTADSPLLVSAEQAAQLMGVSERTIWTWDAEARIPAPIRMSERLIRWGRRELEDWVSAGCPTRDAWNRLKIQRQKGGT